MSVELLNLPLHQSCLSADRNLWCGGGFIKLDNVITEFINRIFQNPLLDFILPIISVLGQIQFILLVIFILFIVGFIRRLKKIKRFCFISFSSLVLFRVIIVEFIKNIVARPRPFISLANIHIVSGESVSKYSSLPSGHAVVAWFMAYIVSRYYPKQKFIFYLLALLVSFSRVYMGLHYFSDVLIGGLLGFYFGKIACKIETAVVVRNKVEK